MKKVAVVLPTRIFDPWETYLTIGTIGLCPDGRWPDHTSLSLAAILRNKGYDVKYFDGENRLLETFDLANEVADWNPDWVVATSETVDYERAPQINYSYVNRFVEMVKMRIPKTKVVVYGTHALVDDISISNKVDYVIKGDPEIAVPDCIAGAYCKGVVHKTEDLDSIPDPAVDLLEGYKGECSEYASGLKGKFIQLALSRGCPHGCAFCYRSTGSNIRKMSPDRVERLVKGMKQQGYESFFFIDDNWGGGDKEHTWAKEVCRKIEPLGIKWSCQTRSDVAKDVDLVKLMKKSGCETVGFGLETYNADLLKLNGKNQTLEDVDAAVESLKSAELKTILFWVLGLFGDSWSHVQKTVDYIKKVKPYGAGCLLAVPFPMSPMSKCKEGFVYPAYMNAGMVGNGMFQDLYDARRRWKEIDEEVSNPYTLLKQVQKFRPNVYQRYEIALDMLRKQGKMI